jgi:2,5-diketo-D-gluconate reductase B
MEGAVEIQGNRVPALGLGTWLLTGADCVEGVRDALELGYRHVDTARAYGNEREVGEGLRASGVPREEVFLTTKVSPNDAAPHRVRASCEASLADLGVRQVDLLLLHWPSRTVPLADTLEAMSVLLDETLIARLGVSNFPPAMLRDALDLAPVFCDQVKLNPYVAENELLELAVERDILVTAYSPLARGRVARDATLREIAAAHDKTPAQVALRWVLDHPNVCTVPKASSHARRLENLDVFDFALTEEERARIDALAGDGGVSRSARGG